MILIPKKGVAHPVGLPLHVPKSLDLSPLASAIHKQVVSCFRRCEGGSKLHELQKQKDCDEVQCKSWFRGRTDAEAKIERLYLGLRGHEKKKNGVLLSSVTVVVQVPVREKA